MRLGSRLLISYNWRFLEIQISWWSKERSKFPDMKETCPLTQKPSSQREGKSLFEVRPPIKKPGAAPRVLDLRSSSHPPLSPPSSLLTLLRLHTSLGFLIRESMLTCQMPLKVVMPPERLATTTDRASTPIGRAIIHLTPEIRPEVDIDVSVQVAFRCMPSGALRALKGPRMVQKVMVVVGPQGERSFATRPGA
jgi:hypothetical protein